MRAVDVRGMRRQQGLWKGDAHLLALLAWEYTNSDNSAMRRAVTGDILRVTALQVM